MIRAKVTEVLTKNLGRPPTEEEIEETMETLSQDYQFHSSLLASATPQQPSAKRARDDSSIEEQTPAPTSKRQRVVKESPNDVSALK